MNIEQLEQTQAEQDLKNLWKPCFGRYYGMELRVTMRHPDVYFILRDGFKRYYFRSDFGTWMTYPNPDIVSKCMEIANI